MQPRRRRLSLRPNPDTLPAMKWVRRAALAITLPLALVIGLLLFPQPLFGHSLTHGNFQIWSDRPIDPAIAAVLDDAGRRLRRSELYEEGEAFRIFICNEPWRLGLLTRSTQVGGVAETVFTRNIYLRELDIPANRLVPPWGRLADAEVRTLSYFIAHEAVHVLQSRRFGRLNMARHPAWLTEGYADWVAKAGAFDFEENRRLLRAGDPRLDVGSSGLYRRYHLMVAELIERRGFTAERLFTDPPSEAEVIRLLQTSS